MRSLFQRIKKNGKRIEAIQEQKECVKSMPYYGIFGTPNERNKDLQTCDEALRAHINERCLLLESLQLEINKELHILSQMQRQQNLQKTA